MPLDLLRYKPLEIIINFDVKVLPSGEALKSGERNERFVVNKAGKLLIRKSSSQDSGFYRCIATSPDPVYSGAPSVAEISTIKITVFPDTDGKFFFNLLPILLTFLENAVP